jgi:hypothetical protein
MSPVTPSRRPTSLNSEFWILLHYLQDCKIDAHSAIFCSITRLYSPFHIFQTRNTPHTLLTSACRSPPGSPSRHTSLVIIIATANSWHCCHASRRHQLPRLPCTHQTHAPPPPSACCAPARRGCCCAPHPFLPPVFLPAMPSFTLQAYPPPPSPSSSPPPLPPTTCHCSTEKSCPPVLTTRRSRSPTNRTLVTCDACP